MRRVAPAAAALALATWPVASVRPQATLDDSWRVALQLAAAHDLGFGRDILFTYGPLGFLSTPLVVSVWPGALALAYTAAAQIALAAVILAAAVRVYGWLLGAAAAFVALGLLGQPVLLSETAVVLAFFATVWVLERDEPTRHAWLVPAGGVLAAFELLVKLNGGIVCLVLFALAAWRLPPGRARAELTLLGSFAAALVVLWVASGNALGELPAWLRESASVVTGYTGAMAYEAPGRLGAYAWAGVLLAGGAAALAAQARRLPPARALLLALAGLVYAYAYFKEGFVRHDPHDLLFFSALGAGALAFSWAGRVRWAGAALVAVAAAATLATPEIGIAQWNPIAHARDAARNVRDLASSGAAATDARSAMRAQLGVPAAELRLLRGHTVDIVPYEAAAAWAYGLRWQPDPLLQWYMAYNATLDRFNARALASRGAERILREAGNAVDGKVTQFEAPATYLALVCHYRQLAADGKWEVLARSRNRCGPRRLLERVGARSGETVHVPRGRPDELVYARLSLPRSFGIELETAFFKPIRLPRIELDGENFRFIPATATDPLVLRIPRTGGFSAAFGGAESHDSFRLLRVPSPYRIEFDAVSLAPAR